MKASKYLLILLSLLLCLTHLEAQVDREYSSIDLYNDLEKLNVVGSVLYIAAHPDDENTRLISYMANEKKVRTAYLSLTRGDGGQNLIGTDIREKLGVIRTNELLQARSIDGGEQFFTRANDFGFSKHPDETLEIWNKDEVMHDIIKVIREFRPDVIVNRFDHRSPGSTHGHHTSSAMLSVEAFDKAGDPSQYADRLGHLEPWQPERVFFNTSWWFYGSRENFESADKTNLFAIDAGVYYPERGLSNGEIAGLSRSMHKSQGFGSTGSRGSENEYLELLKGSRPADKEDPLEGIDMTWNRIDGGAAIKGKIDVLLANFNFTNPETNIPALLDIYRAVEGISNEHWKKIKLKELENMILASAGIFLDATTNSATAVVGDKISIDFEAVNRGSSEVNLAAIEVNNGGENIEVNASLPTNERIELESTFSIPTNIQNSNPYWLNETGTMGMYKVSEDSQIGTPLSEPAFTASFTISVDGLELQVDRPVHFNYNDPVAGEVVQPFYVVPSASVAFADPVYIFPDRQPKEIEIKVKAYTDSLTGVISLDHPASWIVSPKIIEVNIPNKGQSESVTFTVKGPFLSESGEMTAQLLTNTGEVVKKEVYEITHDHIPNQIILSDAISKFERLSIEKKGNDIAYVQGAGDDVPNSLRQIGYNVDEMDVDDITADNLSSYDALIMGVRAYNTKPELKLKKSVFQAYMENGGTIIVQYNTNRRGARGNDIGPYPMTLSRDRVTDENASVSFIDAEHEVLNFPNKISSRDFQNWVQERGLYFPAEWDSMYQAPLACSDKLESMKQGGLLIAPVGKGYFIYTGYSWFRQLPAGVPGAFRIFANLISIGKNGLVIPAEETSNDD